MNGHLLRFSIPVATSALFLSVSSHVAENTKPKSGVESDSPNAKYFEVTKKVHALIVKKSATKSPLDAYSELIPKAGGSKLPMLHVEGGGFMFGSPADEEERKADKGWKGKDPQVPKSIWYHTDSQHVGFRIVRPVKIPSAEEMHRYWNSDWFAPERNQEDL